MICLKLLHLNIVLCGASIFQLLLWSFGLFPIAITAGGLLACYKEPCTHTLSNISVATVLSSNHICTKWSSMCIYLLYRSMCICVVCVHVCIHKNKLYILNKDMMVFLVFALMYNMFNFIHVLIIFFSSPHLLLLFFVLFFPQSLVPPFFF